EEIVAVVLVVLLFLLHVRSALVPLVTLPLVLLLAFAAMWALGVPATIMSLGGLGIALGIAVDADVVALEACHRRLEAQGGAPPGERREALVSASAAGGPAAGARLGGPGCGVCARRPCRGALAPHHRPHLPAHLRLRRRDGPAAAAAG